MKTLKEYSEFLFKNNYEEAEGAYLLQDGHLETVDFINKGNNFYVKLRVQETPEFSSYLQSLEEETIYEINYENYIVTGAFIEASICNVSDFLTGKTDGIHLIDEPCNYNYHTLDLFEFCIGLQKVNLVEHELFIMSRRLEQLKWANEVLIPILEKYDYHVSYDVFFNTNQEDRCNSNPRLDLTHANREQLVLEIDCLTGKSIIWHTALTEVVNLSDKIYGKNSDEVFNILLEEIWKKDEEKYGYIYNNDPHETVDTYHEVGELFMCLKYKEKTKREINFDVIPSRYSDFVEQYKNLQYMTQKEKDIIYKDACGRILYKPYAVYEFEGELIQVQITGMDGDEPTSPFYGYSFDTWGHIPHDNVKLYLRPMSSMTEKERDEYNKTKAKIAVQWDGNGTPIGYEYVCTIKTFDWLNEHHFDYRGLISKGLAIEVNENNNPYID